MKSRTTVLQLIHSLFVYLLQIERRFDPFFRPYLDALLREPIARNAGLNKPATPARRPAAGRGEASPAEEASLGAIAANNMAAYMRAHYKPGGFERAGNTKTHGVLRGEFIIRDDLPAELRQGVFTEPRSDRAWVRFAGPGPEQPARYRRCRRPEHWHQTDGCPKLLEDEKLTEDFTGIICGHLLLLTCGRIPNFKQRF